MGASCLMLAQSMFYLNHLFSLLFKQQILKYQHTHIRMNSNTIKYAGLGAIILLSIIIGWLNYNSPAQVQQAVATYDNYNYSTSADYRIQSSADIHLEGSLTLETLSDKHCRLYDELDYKMKDSNLNNLIPSNTGDELISKISKIIDEGKKVVLKKRNLDVLKDRLKNTKTGQQPDIASSLDTTKLSRTYSQLIEKKQTIDNKQVQLGILKQNPVTSNEGGIAWQISAETQMLTYLNKRKDYLKSLRPQTENMDEALRGIDKTGDTLNEYEKLFAYAEQHRGALAKLDRLDTSIDRAQTMEQYWKGKLDEVSVCQQENDERMSKKVDASIFRELEKLKLQQMKFHNQLYCKNLTSQVVAEIIKAFDFYQSNFRCIQDKPVIEREYRLAKEKLNDLLREKENLNKQTKELKDKLTALKNSYSKDSGDLINRISPNTVRTYDAATLRDLIASIDKEIQQHKNRLSTLRQTPTNTDSQADLFKLITEINALKVQYCREESQYRKEAEKAQEELAGLKLSYRKLEDVRNNYDSVLREITSSLATVAQLKSTLPDA